MMIGLVLFYSGGVDHKGIRFYICLSGAAYTGADKLRYSYMF